MHSYGTISHWLVCRRTQRTKGIHLCDETGLALGADWSLSPAKETLDRCGMQLFSDCIEDD